MQGLSDPEYGNFKDKAIDLKYQFLSEGKYMPALAIGIMDPHGTRVYPSQYIVASKQIYPFDFTIGFGNGRFGKKPLTSSSEGVKIEIDNRYRRLAERFAVLLGYSVCPFREICTDV